jgi:intracellular sulfur oxidation DsrE/DsrF family protein
MTQADDQLRAQPRQIQINRRLVARSTSSPCANKEHDVTSPDKPLHIDIPVKLDDVKAVFSIETLAFQGDLPASIIHLQVITSDIANWGATSEVVAVFHTNAGHVTLQDEAYNTERNIKTGNPYKQLIAGLLSRGVHVELCGATARVHRWRNEDLLPGIKVNTDAGARMLQLVQQGFVKITED